MSSNPILSRIRTRAPQPRGVVLVTVVTISAICLTLFGLWARAAVQQHQRWQLKQLRPQAMRLAEAGLQRAIARRAADPAYNQETWQLAADEFGQNRAAEVRIRISPSEDETGLQFEATAEFPAGAVRRAQVTKRLEIPNPAVGDET